MFQIWIALFFVSFEVDKTKNVANTKPRRKFLKKLQSESTSLVKTMKNRTIPKGDNKNVTVKDKDIKDDHSKPDVNYLF